MVRLPGTLAPLALAACAHSGIDSVPAIEIARPIVLVSDTLGSEVAAYAIFTNRGPDTAIVSAACTCADKVELHVVDRSAPSRGMMSSFPLALPSGEAVATEPPGVPRHLMLVGLRRPIAKGDVVSLRFTLADGEVVEQHFTAVPNSVEAWKGFEGNQNGAPD